MMHLHGQQLPEHQRGILHRFYAIAFLTILIPVLVVSYLIYTTGISLDDNHLLMFAMTLLLMLAGLVILRYVFTSIMAVVDILKRHTPEDGTLPLVIREDVSELKEISACLTNLMNRFEKTTDELDRRVFELNTVNEMAEITRKTLHMDELLKIVLEKAMAVVRAQTGSIFTVDGEAKPPRLVASSPPGTVPNGTSVNLERSFMKRVLDDRKTIIVQNIESDPRTLKPNDPKYGPPSFLSMPIFAGHALIAVLNLANKESGLLFDELDERIVSTMLGSVSFALENARLHSQIKDQLEEILAKNVTLEREVRDRLRAEEDLRRVNVELKDANDRMTAAYDWMRANRDRLLNHRDREEIGFVVDREGTIEEITERALEYAGKPRGEMIGGNLTDLLAAPGRDAFKGELRHAWSGVTRTLRVEMLQPLESETTCEATLTRLTSASRRALLVVLR
jgi:PAS domain-containing protein